MAGGPGKYDAAAEEALLTTGAGAVVLLVLNGFTGSGLSVSMDFEVVAPTTVAAQLPTLLRSVASSIEADL